MHLPVHCSGVAWDCEFPDLQHVFLSGTRSALSQVDSTRGGAGGLQAKEQEKRSDSRSSRDSSLPPHLLQRTAKAPLQRDPAGLTRLVPPSPEQSATLDSSTAWQSSPGQTGSGRAEPYRQQAAPHLSQSPKTQAQSDRDPALRASTGSKRTIRDLLSSRGIYLKSYAPGQHTALICPTCKGGSSSEESLSVKIEDDSQSAAWCCHRGTCGWEGGGSLSADSPAAPGRSGRAVLCCSPHFILEPHLGVLTGRALSALHTMASVAYLSYTQWQLEEHR